MTLLVSGIDIDYVARTRAAARQTLALADGEHLDPLVLGHAIACFVVNPAGMKIRFTQVRAQKGLVIISGHEADFLAVRLVGRLQSKLTGNRPNLRLLHGAEGKQRAPKLRLAKAEKKIRLVFPRVAPAAQHRAVGVMLDDGVVSRGDKFGAQRLCLPPKIAKLHLLIAHHARIRRAALCDIPR